MSKYTKHFSTKQAKQGQKIPGKKMVKNSDGAYVFGVDDWTRLDRFLILGSEGGSYYASERKLTVENAEAIVRLLEGDQGTKVVDRIVEISKAGRAAKNDQAIFALALAAKLGDESTRRAAYQALSGVCRIPTHLFAFAEACEGFGGWGRGMRNAVSRWYTDRPDSQLAYHLVKYQQRNGWSNRDLLRLAHAKPKSEIQNSLFHWVTQGTMDKTPGVDYDSVRIIEGFERAKTCTSKREIVKLITDYGLTREMIPTQFLSEASVWEALFQKMPMGAMVRNLGNMTKVDFLKPMSAASKEVCSRLVNAEAIKKARLHPLALLVALETYRSGKGSKGAGAWTPVAKVNSALEKAFYLAFDTIEPTGKSHLLCIDTSESMTGMYGYNYYGYGRGARGRSPMAALGGISPRVASAVMAMVTAKTEEGSLFISYSDKASEMAITADWNLQAVIDRIGKYPAYGTNCAAPIEHAIKRGYDVDTIILYTDSETNHHNARHPVAALNDLRQKLGHDVKFIVVGMVSNGFSVADPNDKSMLDVVGFDTAAPALIGEFSAGRI